MIIYVSQKKNYTPNLDGEFTIITYVLIDVNNIKCHINVLKLNIFILSILNDISENLAFTWNANHVKMSQPGVLLTF